MTNLPLNALRAFATVCDAGGIRPAARLLNVTHSSVSRHVKELELWIGAPLLEKDGGKTSFRLTVQGKTLGAAVRETLGALEGAVTRIREHRGPNSVVISTTASVAVRWLLPRLHALARALPRVEVSVLTEQALVVPDGRDVDLAIRMGKGPWPDVECTPLMDDALYPVVHARLLRPRGSPAALFAKHPLLHDRDPQAAWSAWFSAYPQQGIDVRQGPRFASSDLVLRAASQGFGIALARDRLAADDVANGALARPFADAAVPLENAYWIVAPHGGAARPATRSVIEWLHGEAR